MTSKRLAAGLAVVVMLAPGLGQAGAISRACVAADRGSASPQLCGCIQKVANASLTRSDRKLAASFFADPQKAQDIRTSNRRNHEEFWDRYTSFGKRAARTCG